MALPSREVLQNVNMRQMRIGVQTWQGLMEKKKTDIGLRSEAASRKPLQSDELVGGPARLPYGQSLASAAPRRPVVMGDLTNMKTWKQDPRLVACNVIPDLQEVLATVFEPSQLTPGLLSKLYHTDQPSRTSTFLLLLYSHFLHAPITNALFRARQEEV